MRRLYFLGLGAGIKHTFHHVFACGSSEDVTALESELKKRYKGEAMATKNGRTALALALKAYFSKGDRIIVNGFTCYAVIEAVKAAGCVPVYADINRETLNFDTKTLDSLWARAEKHDDICGIIVQNTLGNVVDMRAIERFSGKHGLIIIEDLAHSAGRHYADGREVGTVGMATALSFGKDKVIDTVSGGAVIFRYPCKNHIEPPKFFPKKSDQLRARLYPMFGAWCRHLTRCHLGGVLMRMLIRMHLVERSADNRLDLTRKIAPFEAKLAGEQLKKLSDKPIRDFYLVRRRHHVLKELREAGYYFDGFWYEKPVSPERYYKKANFPEEDCPVAVEVAEKIINLPKYYGRGELMKARKIVEMYQKEEASNEKG